MAPSPTPTPEVIIVDTLRTWLGRHGWILIIGAMLLLGIWSFVDEQAARWVSTALLVAGLSALAAKGIWRASRASRP